MAASSLRTKDMFLRNAIEKILQDKDIKKPHNSQLKKACEVALDELNNELAVKGSKEQANGPHIVPSKVRFVEADKYFLPFELACQSTSVRIVDTALDCLQKLIAYGHLTGKAQDNLNPGRLLIDRVIKTICDCFRGVKTDKGIQLQIIKALLTIVTSPNCEVHGNSLILAVRTVYNLYLASTDQVNQATAKATISQTINIVFTRMEADAAAQSATSSAAPASLEAEVEQILQELVTEVCLREGENAVIEEVGAGGGSVSGDGGSIGAETISLRSEGGEILAVTAPPVLGSSASVNSTPEHLRTPTESFDVNVDPATPGHGPVLDHPQLQKDAFYLFRALCKLSVKDPDETDLKTHKMRSRILSLQMLLACLQNAGPTFKTKNIFISAIRQYLCDSLSINGVSPVPEVFELSLAIFVSLLANFKVYLKRQIEVFFQEIFLNILESPTSSFEHKWYVMQALSKICSDAQSVVDIYVNYDCDLTGANIFGRLVNILSKIAHGRHHAESSGVPSSEHSMRVTGLECLVSILKCMVEWSKELYVAPESQANLAQTRSDLENSILETEKQNGHPGVSLHSSSSGSSLPTNASVYEMEQTKQRKEVMETAIALFNQKPKMGLKFLQERGLLGVDPVDVARFFHKEDRLDKAVVGDFLGDGDQFCREVMYAFVDLMNFAERDFVSALRQFLEGFRLPGEAQKIDRLMEKFASRYCETNPNQGIFASADTAYVLAYSIIMLTTDLHSAQVRHKMTKEQYIRMNRGINDSADLPEKYLSDIYDEIAAEEIKMKTQSTKFAKQASANVTNERQRRLLNNLELGAIAQTARNLMQAACHAQAPSTFMAAVHSEHVRPMFKLAHSPCLAVFSVGLQETDNLEIVKLCLDGFQCAIRIACIFHMELERDTYVQALARFTLLTASSHVGEMKSKNIETIKTLIVVALTDGNYLGGAWLEILRCISSLELVQLIGTGVRPRFLQTPPGKTGHHHAGHHGRQDTVDHGGLALNSLQKNAILQESLDETKSQSVVVAVDRIFTGSVNLDGDAIVQFVKALCQVSMEELSNPMQPRMFCLQKIVEISYYNMNRIRLQWSRIWEVLGDHFNKAGGNANEDIAFFAVDSLRQLSMKFLERPELPNFRFQKEFLRPFEFIMKRTRSLTIRDMIVRCMEQMQKSQTRHIKSGWKNIFSVFYMAASEHEENIVALAYTTTKEIIKGVFAHELGSLIDSFGDAIKCLSEFACNSCSAFIDMSMEAINLIRDCARYVAEHPQVFSEHRDDLAVAEAERPWVRGWFPILFELSCVVSRCKLDVRTRALTVMFEIVKTHGGEFKPSWWKEFFQVAFRIFDVMKLPEQQTEKAEWMMTTCTHALHSISDVFSHYYEQLSTVVMSDLYAQLQWCIEQENEQLADSGVTCLESVVLGNGPKFSPKIWAETVKLLLKVFADTSPDGLLTWQPDSEQLPHIVTAVGQSYDQQQESNLRKESSISQHSIISAASDDGNHGNGPAKIPHSKIPANFSESFTTLLIKCIIHLKLISALDAILFSPASSKHDDEMNFADAQNVVRQANAAAVQEDDIEHGMYGRLSTSQLLSLVECLLRSHAMAVAFNSNNTQRTLLWKAGFKGQAKPNLIKQEVASVACALRILFRLYSDPSHKSDFADVERRLVRVAADAVEYFHGLSSEQHREHWTGIVLLILARCLRLPDEQFSAQARSYFDKFYDLIDANVKTEVKTLIKKAVRRHLSIRTVR